jgi:uncharacterized protein (DUF1800 family)
MPRADEIQHLARRAGFGASAAELSDLQAMSLFGAVEYLVNYDRLPDNVDSFIGTPGYVGITAGNGAFQPNTVIGHARQRWLFRMVHSARPLQEKMTLFWHNHFATAYSKIAGAYGGVEGTRMMAAKASEDPGRFRGQIELLRDAALGNFRDLLVEIAKDPAMLVWLDGRTNVKAKPQENFGRELMELFTMGVGFYTEPDVYAAARVFTGWNLTRVGAREEQAGYYAFVYNAGQHDTTAKEFSFPMYSNGSRTIPARSASDGMQDGIDLITACARHPETARRLARKLWSFFISDVHEPDPSFVNGLATAYLENNFNMKIVMRTLLRSRHFNDPVFRYCRYSWPVEFVARSLKEVGWAGFSVNSALSPLANMGQQLFEPPDVAGWSTGDGWFSTGSMLARMNFAATLTANQRFNIANDAKGKGQTPNALLSYYLDLLSPASYSSQAYQDLLGYLTASGAWTGSDQQITIKAPGLVHLIAGSSEYQFV